VSWSFFNLGEPSFSTSFACFGHLCTVQIGLFPLNIKEFDEDVLPIGFDEFGCE
jgi:hypothetical protein